MDMSLDDFIRLKKGVNNNLRKKDKDEIDKDGLDAELDQITGKKTPTNSSTYVKKDRSFLSKFDRINTANDSDEDDDNDVVMSTQNSSIEFAKEIEKMDHPNCCNFKPFRTIEDKTKVKIKSQQWRLGNNPNQHKKGTSSDNSSGVRNGRVGKNNRDSSINGFVRGNFTYGSAGIVRNNRRPMTNDEPPNDGTSQIILRKNVHAPGLNRRVQVNIDVTELCRANQMRNIAPLLAPPSEYYPMRQEMIPTGTAHLRMAFESDDLMAFLQAKKLREQQLQSAGNGGFIDASMKDASNFL